MSFDPRERLPAHLGWAYIIAALLCLAAGVAAALAGASDEWAVFAVGVSTMVFFGIVAILHRGHELAKRRAASPPPDDDAASS